VSPRRRLGVALVVDPPLALEIDGLRRALGDGPLDAVVPHITLVPPVNVRVDELDQALAVLRRAAQGQGRPLELVLGPVATFSPVTPVIYLAVRGAGDAGLDDLHRLHQGVMAGPLLRTERWPWAPHVTLADESPPERIDAALVALGSYRAEVAFDRVVILEEVGRRWSVLADACFGPPAVVGRGGLELEISEGRAWGPDGLALARAAGLGDAELDLLVAERSPPAVVLTGRRGGEVVGVATAWPGPLVGAPAHACVLVGPDCRGQGVGRILLSTLEARVRAAGWAEGGVVGHGPPEFYARASAWVRDFEPTAQGGD